MCFSAGASFAAGNILCTAGIISMRRTSDSGAKYFAAIPLAFGVQQLGEGCLWLSLQGLIPASYSALSMYFFLLVAQVFWPTWVPLSFYMLDQKHPAGKILRWFLASGILVSAVLGWFLFHDGATATVEAYHVDYTLGRPHGWIGKIFTGLYLAVTILPPFISSRPKMRMLGIALAISALVSFILYYTWFVSVWCFFAALISFWVLYLVGQLRKAEETQMETQQAHVQHPL